MFLIEISFSEPAPRFRIVRQFLGILALLVVVSFAACEPANGPAENTKPAEKTNTPSPPAERTEPTIEAAPVTKGDDQWEVLTSNNVTLTVNAPGAQSVRIFYRPAVAEDRHVELKRLDSPKSDSSGTFATQVKIPADFAGDVWAEVNYPNGEKKEAKPISLTVENIPSEELADASYKHTDESARSDKLTGGKIEKTTFVPGQPNIRITINVPAFQLTLWQDGKEVKTYQIGIGRKEFPLPTGLRRATQIVFNPEWVPPDSSWVDEHDVSPGERIEADDPRNPLGKVKIPLGNGVLIHQASRPYDLGHLVSHGCVRLMLNDLFDLAEKIIAARSLKVSKEQIDHARSSKDRLAVKLDAPLIVDINYDTQVIEGGVLHLYPDVYGQRTNTIENLRQELEQAGVDSSRLDDNTLNQMLRRVGMTQQFVVSLSDITSARGLAAGQIESLTSEPVKAPSAKTRTRGKART